MIGDKLVLFDTFITSDGSELKLNPNKEIVNKIVSRIKLNSGHCPCRLELTPETICPCENFLVNGVCHCSLYI